MSARINKNAVIMMSDGHALDNFDEAGACI